jgi:hypothetical protein
MKALMSASSSLFVNENRIVLFWDMHSWSVSLRATHMSPALLTELKSIVDSILEQLSASFPVGERDFAHLLSIFEIGTFQHMTTDECNSFGEEEIRDLLGMLSKPQAAASATQFWCKVPFIEPNQTDEVSALLKSCVE